MATGMLHTHYLMVVLFTLIYLVKTILLLSDKHELLEKFKQVCVFGKGILTEKKDEILLDEKLKGN